MKPVDTVPIDLFPDCCATCIYEEDNQCTLGKRRRDLEGRGSHVAANEVCGDHVRRQSWDDCADGSEYDGEAYEWFREESKRKGGAA